MGKIRPREVKKKLSQDTQLISGRARDSKVDVLSATHMPFIADPSEEPRTWKTLALFSESMPLSRNDPPSEQTLA